MMKKILVTLFTFLVAAPLTLSAQQVLPERPKAEPGSTNLRLMCYNVRNCKGADDRISYKRVADVINRCAPDVVAVQELDSMTTRYPDQYVLGNLARRTKMKGTFCHSIEYKGGRYGVGLLSKQRPLSVERLPLPCSREPRVLLIAEFKEYYMLVTHWSLDAGYRVQTAEILNNLLPKLKKKAVFLCGDFNAKPTEASMELLSKGYDVQRKQGSRFTFPAWEPKREIDYLCVGRNGVQVEVANHIVVEAPTASDHAPFIADITIK